MVAVARAGSPGAGAAVRIQWNAPAGCSDADAFFSGVQARAEGVRRAQAGEPALRLEVHLERTSSAKVHGELRMADERGRFELRKVDGGTCDEVVDALSLTVALALGSSAVAPAPSRSGPAGSSVPSVPAGSSSPSSAPTSARPPPVAAPPAHDDAVAPPPAAAVPPPLSPPPIPPPPDKVEAAAGPEAPVESPAPSRPAPRRGSIGIALGLGPVAGQVSTPGFDVGGTALLRVGPGRAGQEDEAVHWSLGLSATYLRNDWLGASPAVAISWSAVGLTACPGWGLDLHVVLEICGTTAVGRLQATDRAVSVSTPSSRSWWSAGPVLRARLTLGWGLTVLIDATAHFPFYRRTFVTSTPDETVARTPSVAGTVGVMLAREL